ncbi:MAG: Endodeoxyribonuclease RusA [Firmicutes bacterium]|nr:Endodeoxyribonuclease RusA [Bacillota bacterium]
MINFTVFGEAVAQGRPKFTTINGHAKAYDPAKSRSYKQIVRDEALKYKPSVPLQEAIKLRVVIYKGIPKSFSQKRRILAIAGSIRPTTKPDVDNVVKGIKDALKSVIWRDDSQVVELAADKFYSETPRVEIEISALEC